jgi:hypothetical protein
MKTRILPKTIILAAIRRARTPFVPIATVRDQIGTDTPNDDGPIV